MIEIRPTLTSDLRLLESVVLGGHRDHDDRRLLESVVLGGHSDQPRPRVLRSVRSGDGAVAATGYAEGSEAVARGVRRQITVAGEARRIGPFKADPPRFAPPPRAALRLPGWSHGCSRYQGRRSCCPT